MRVSFSDIDYNGVIDTNEVLQTDHYYPFGMRLGGLSYQAGTENRYRYNGKELHRELGLGWYDYGFRWYDPVVARFVSVDPLAEKFPELTTYQYASNTPIQAIDLDGLEAYFINSKGSDVDPAFFAQILSLITGYSVNIASEATEISSPDGSTTFMGYEIIASDARIEGSEGVPGFGDALHRLLQRDDVQIGLQFGDVSSPNRVEDYFTRNENPLTFDNGLFNGEAGTSTEFMAHLFTHEIAETMSAARNGGANDYGRDHIEAAKLDIQAARKAMGHGGYLFDTRNLNYVLDAEFIKNGERYTDPTNNIMSVNYQKGSNSAREKIIDVYFRSTTLTGNVTIWPK